MTLEVNIHDAQTSILRELLFYTSVNFAKLQKLSGLSSDHFNFHLQKLIDSGLVAKLSRWQYALTPRGKEYANKLDTDNNTIERQPKVSVILVVERELDGAKQYVFQKRLKHPYYGYLGLISGKVRWGELIIETAKRELLEETGLIADCSISGVYHEMAYQHESGDQLEDKIFFIVHCVNTKGDLVKKFEGGENKWMTLDEALIEPKTFKNLDMKINFVYSNVKITELSVECEKDVF